MFPFPFRASTVACAPRAAKLQICCLLATPVLLAAVSAQAQINPQAIGRQNQVIERQQQERLREEQERALQQAPRGGTDLKAIEPKVSVPDIGVPCRDIREIRIGGGALLPPELRRQLTGDYAGRCLAVGDLEAVLAAITKSYIERGYITTRAYLPAQDLRSGVLEISVVEGTIERYELQNAGRPGAKAYLPGAFPARPGERLNLRDLEQGIDQLNSLASNNASLDVQPGSQPGQSVVVVTNQAGTPVHLYASYDNLGTPSTGKNALSATVSFDGLLGLNELFAVTRRQSVPHDGEHNSETTALRAVLPWGYNTLSLDASESQYVNMLALPNGNKLASEGTTVTQSMALDRVIFRDQASRVSLGGRLTAQDTRSFLGGEFLQVSSRKISTLDLGISGFTQVGGGIANGRIGYVRGLKAFGALDDLDGLPQDYPHAQFGKFMVDLGYSRRFELAGGTALLFSSQVSGQYTRDVLYGSQQVLIGGASTVRGFLLNTLSGDRGMFAHNDLSLPWQTTLGGAPLAGRVYAGYDFGTVRNNAPFVPQGSISGVALGVALQLRSVSVDLFASRAAHLPSWMPSESTLYSIRLSASL